MEEGPQPGARVPQRVMEVRYVLGQPNDPLARLPGVTPGQEDRGLLDAVVPPEHSSQRSAERVHLAPHEAFHADRVDASSTVQRDVGDAAERVPPCLDNDPRAIGPIDSMDVPDHLGTLEAGTPEPVDAAELCPTLGITPRPPRGRVPIPSSRSRPQSRNRCAPRAHVRGDQSMAVVESSQRRLAWPELRLSARLVPVAAVVVDLLLLAIATVTAMLGRQAAASSSMPATTSRASSSWQLDRCWWRGSPWCEASVATPARSSGPGPRSTSGSSGPRCSAPAWSGIGCYLTSFPLSRGFFLLAFAIGTPLLVLGRWRSGVSSTAPGSTATCASG